MALRQILKEGDPTLNKKSREIKKFDGRLHELIDDMIETLKDANGAGLAAPQVGVLRRVVIVDDEEGGFHELVNPVISFEEGEQDGPEGCLSIPGIWGMVKRPMKVTLKAQDRFGNDLVLDGEGITARAFCHEVEHLDGHLFIEKVHDFLTAEDLEHLREEESEIAE